MKSRGTLLFQWWIAGTFLYGISAGCLAIAFGFFNAWSFGMNGQYIVLFRNRFLFPTQMITPLPESFDMNDVFLHSFSSGALYALLGVLAVFGYHAIERLRRGE